MTITKSETALVLALAAAYDQRTIGDSDIEAWYELLARHPDVDFEIAKRRVKDHYEREHRRVMPSDVLSPPHPDTGGMW
jgi:hypothetical protein